MNEKHTSSHMPTRLSDDSEVNSYLPVEHVHLGGIVSSDIGPEQVETRFAQPWTGGTISSLVHLANRAALLLDNREGNNKLSPLDRVEIAAAAEAMTRAAEELKSLLTTKPAPKKRVGNTSGKEQKRS